MSDSPLWDGLSGSLPRHFVPGYYQPVPPGRKALAYPGPRIKLPPMGGTPYLREDEEVKGDALRTCRQAVPACFRASQLNPYGTEVAEDKENSLSDRRRFS
jgi:hypothetical protein